MVSEVRTTWYTFLVNKPGEIAVNMPLGKPNPRLPCESIERDNRERVPQGSKGLCWFDAFNTIRPRIGKVFGKFQQEREVESQISSYVKTERQAPLLVKVFSRIAKHIGPDVESVKKFLEKIEENPQFLLDTLALLKIRFNPNELELYCNTILYFFQDYISQSPPRIFEGFCAEDAMNHYILRGQELLKSFGTNIECENKKLSTISSGFLSFTSWDDLSLPGKKNMMHNLICRIAYQRYGLAESKWRPGTPCFELIREIATYGPLVIFGNFGRAYYNKPAHRLPATLANHDLYGWNAEDRKKEDLRDDTSIAGHAVTVIGAKYNADNDDASLVYFIDPILGSDPAKPEGRTIFVMTLKRLRSEISSLTIEKLFVWKDKDHREPILPPNVNYAIYRP